jgi:hypothetical protein|tara:strand:+ start:167 stop:424 length:258 start_codon:yes stop_codon:yes gene_type:complete
MNYLLLNIKQPSQFSGGMARRFRQRSDITAETRSSVMMASKVIRAIEKSPSRYNAVLEEAFIDAKKDGSDFICSRLLIGHPVKLA